MISRKISVVLLLFALLFIFCSITFAAQEILDKPESFGSGILFVSGVSTQSYDFISQPSGYGKQRRSNWCWAAAIQMVLNFHGTYISQEDIVNKLFGPTLPNVIAYDHHVLAALDGRGVKINPTMKTLIDELSDDNPLIVGLKGTSTTPGHIYVLTAIYYFFPAKTHPSYNSGHPLPVKFVLRDPWPYSPTRIEMSPEEFASRLNLCVKVN